MFDVSLPDGIQAASPDEWQRVADITTDAFAKDPVSLWTFGNAEAIRTTFRTMARRIYLPNGICHIANAAGATMWLPPGNSEEMALIYKVELALRLMQHAGTGAIRRTLQIDAQMTRHHPKHDHLYLFTIGVVAAGRGKGLGRRLMAPMLAAADKVGVPVYLENSNPANTGFYMSQGFVSQQIFQAAPGAPPLEAMERPPRGTL